MTLPTANGYLLTVAYSCDVEFMRWITPANAVRELVWSTLLARSS